MDDLVLNLTLDDQPSSSKSTTDRKGGRVKAKRVAKRKTIPEETLAAEVTHATEDGSGLRPSKRPRKEHPTPPKPYDHSAQSTRRPTQIISSLFSFNPKVEAPVQNHTSIVSSKPSNAPLADSSTFSGLGLDPLITAHLSKMNISKPTSIQRAALSAILSPTSGGTPPRDVFIQSQTGSGKTMAFLLPIIQELLPLSAQSYIDRSIGSLAIIIAPTRELAKQISDVLEALLKLRLRPDDESADDPGSSSTRLTRWLVSGLLTGGATRTHEKARLRKGIPILVSTPGRLLDHLQNTSSFNVSKCRWLVLDEADRLMELGFEETITGIIQRLDGRRKLALQALEEGMNVEGGGWDWDRRRRTVLCSATIREDVQKLANTALINPLMIKATEIDRVLTTPVTNRDNIVLNSVSDEFKPPSQLSQKYVVVPLKLRLVTLVALLRSLVTKFRSHRGAKIIVFLSCTDSVDFHWHLLGSASMDGDENSSKSELDSHDETDTEQVETSGIGDRVKVRSALLPDTSIFRLHGSLPNPTRLASLRGFSALPSNNKSVRPPTPSSSILLCTSLAARGLDLPLVRAVVQHDLPTEGGATEYVHRVGRTARVGKGGEAWSLVSPSEIEWVKWVEAKMQGGVVSEQEDRNRPLEGVAIDRVLRSGFGGKGTEYEERATEVQLAFEKWVHRQKQNTECARKAFLSHIRAYATHPSNEKNIFHIRHLHIGHLAKAFALRDAPRSFTGSATKPGNEKRPNVLDRNSSRREGDRKEGHDGKTKTRMRNIVRTQGRLSKRGGVMMSTSASEFQIATGQLEKIVASRT